MIKSGYFTRKLSQSGAEKPVAAVDYECNAIDEACGVGGEKECGVFDVSDAAESPNGDLFPDHFFYRIGHETLHSLGVLDRAGCDAVDADAVPAPFGRKVASDRVNPRLSGRDVDLHRSGKIVKCRTYIKDLPPRGFERLQKRRTAHVERALRVNIHNRPETIGRELIGSTEKITGRTIDDDVDPSVVLQSFCYRILNSGIITDVRYDREALTAEGFDSLPHRRQIFFLPASDREPCPVLGEGTCDAARDASAASGHKSNFVPKNIRSKKFFRHSFFRKMLPQKSFLKDLALFCLMILVGVLAGAEISCSSQHSDLRTMLPGDALAYVESNDLYRTVEPIVENSSFRDAAAAKPDLSMLKGIQLAVAVTGFEVREEQLNDETSVGKVQPKFVAVADTHAWSWQARRFTENQLGEFINKAYGGGVNLETNDTNDGRKYVWTAEDGRKAFAIVNGSLVFFANDEGSLERSLATRRGEGDSIARAAGVPPASADAIALGYISPEGVQQLSNIAGMSVAVGASEDEEVKSFVARELPEIMRNSVKEVSWVSTTEGGRYSDKYLISLAPDIAKVFAETMKLSNGPDADLAKFVPADAVAASRYNIVNPQIAWRGILLSAQNKTDQLSGKLIAAFSSSLFEPYAVEDAETFLGSVGSVVETVRMDADGENVVVVARVKDPEGVKRSVAKEIDLRKPAEKIGNADVWKSADGDYAAAFVDGHVLLGDAESVVKCLQLAAGNWSFANAPVSTTGKETDAAATLVDVLGERKGDNVPLSQFYSVETRFTQNGMERLTTSDFGLVGRVIEEFSDEK